MSALNRNRIALEIQGTKGEEYYGQICALSQRRENENLKTYFNEHQKLIGLLDAALNPPQAKLQLGSFGTPELHFSQHICSNTSGKIELAAYQILTVNNWVITVCLQVFDGQASRDKPFNKDAADAAATATQLEEIKKSQGVHKLDLTIRKGQEEALTVAERSLPQQAERNRPLSCPATTLPNVCVVFLFICLDVLMTLPKGQWTTLVESRSYLPHPGDGTKKISLADWGVSKYDMKTRLMAIMDNWAEDNQEPALWVPAFRSVFLWPNLWCTRLQPLFVSKVTPKPATLLSSHIYKKSGTEPFPFWPIRANSAIQKTGWSSAKLSNKDYPAVIDLNMAGTWPSLQGAIQSLLASQGLYP
ncbi:hypothetical protein GCG54_00015354 [Colletotrichum gloeosporioides]|uniref:Uncharacterized protein n=1 Tax=Colletotrichum gloeosporioides TaxID=474922 RepID=A0A8H4C8G5_COLGL|nr:uncharacterized protein GCG54_00015354 [Colletotrichum gloeosporioides]KAF3799162.1 hypothetical protein GCG54_00015354 [Colletotrichum gloeosporioides]